MTYFQGRSGVDLVEGLDARQGGEHRVRLFDPSRRQAQGLQLGPELGRIHLEHVEKPVVHDVEQGRMDVGHERQDQTYPVDVSRPYFEDFAARLQVDVPVDAGGNQPCPFHISLGQPLTPATP